MINEENCNIIIVVFLFFFAIYVYWVPTTSQLQEKHVRFSDDNLFHETKQSIIQYIKSLFFGSRVQNGILKSTKYTSDSSYAQIFE
jgi:hypothetical protein